MARCGMSPLELDGEADIMTHRTVSLLAQLQGHWHRARYFVPSANDVFLASFPRSGNTWLRAIFGALVAGRPVESIAELDRLIPEDEVPIRRTSLIKRPFHFVKTHAPFAWNRDDFVNARGIIYIVRDPRDVVLSHFEYIVRLYGYRLDLATFTKDWLAGRIFPGSWAQHALGWMEETASKPQRLCLVRFEDLRADCEGQIERICRELKLGFRRESMKKAVEQATIEEMRAKENRGMRQVERADGYRFIREGKIGDWKDRMDSNTRSRIEQTCGYIMNRFGYNID